MKHTTAQLYVTWMKGSVKGNRNKINPVVLFIIVCRAINVFLYINPHAILLILMMAMMAIQLQSQFGIGMIGNNLIKATAMKIKSETVSIFSPNSLILFVFLATGPSIISLSPQRRYAIKNSDENTGET